MRTPQRTTLLAQRALALFVGGWLLLDFPLLKLGLTSGLLPGTLLGLPRAAAWLFGLWLLVIVLLALLMERAGDED